MSSIDYHLEELKYAMDANNKNHILPEIFESDKVILDIGCGIGQSLLAFDCKNKICIGLDIDQEAIRYGIENHGDKINFILSDGNRLPLPDHSVDLVYSRVAIPYMNIPRVIKEVRRVLKSNGRIWLTLHTKETAMQYLKDAIKDRKIKRFIHVVYILLNGHCLKYFGIVFPFLNLRYESWQDAEAMKKLLEKNGFEAISKIRENHTVVKGRLIQKN